LLLIDEPGSNLTPVVPGFGPSAPQSLCTNPAQGCPEYVNGTVSGIYIAVAVNSINTAGVVATTPGYNVFQGVVSGNSVTFFGVPILPPSTAGVSRVYRITNIRANATTLAGGSASGATPVNASISISGATSIPIANATPIVGFVASGLSTSNPSGTFNQCSSASRSSAGLARFTESFGTAFKTRVVPQSTAAHSGQDINANLQRTPGTVYNSESNFIYTGLSSSAGFTAGLADYGTRLKATFTNLPANVRLFVSVANVNNAAYPIPVPTNPGDNSIAVPYGQSVVGPYAQLVLSETTTDGTSGSFFPAVSPTDNGPGSGNVPIVEILPSGAGAFTAVWEVVNTNPNTQESLSFGVYISYTANVPQNSPTPGTSQVNMSFAPTPTVPFSASSAAGPSSTLNLPRFVADPNAPKTFTTINICRTILLFPYVLNIGGFDTGLAIANTSVDPFGTTQQNGKCLLYWYQGATNPPTTDTGVITGGTVYTALASTILTGFQGYMIAKCDFQYAHGFAFVSDLGSQKLAMGYLALVLNESGNSTLGRGVDSISPGLAH
jgi:hypothetical protein